MTDSAEKFGSEQSNRKKNNRSENMPIKIRIINIKYIKKTAKWMHWQNFKFLIDAK